MCYVLIMENNLKNKDWLTSRLKQIDLQKNEFANLMEIREQHVKRFAELKPKLSLSQFKKLAKILKCNLEGLMEFWDNNISDEQLWSYVPSENASEIDEKLLIKIISKIEELEEASDYEYTAADKARLVKLIYLKIQGLPEREQEEEAGKIASIYDYVKKAN